MDRETLTIARSVVDILRESLDKIDHVLKSEPWPSHSWPMPDSHSSQFQANPVPSCFITTETAGMRPEQELIFPVGEEPVPDVTHETGDAHG